LYQRGPQTESSKEIRLEGKWKEIWDTKAMIEALFSFGTSRITDHMITSLIH
jgi:hypothetical protein